MPETTRSPLTVAVVGATGVVGRTMIQVLNEREFPVGELRLLASGRSAGRTIAIDGQTHQIGEAVARGVRRGRHRPLLGRRRHLARARAAGRGTRRDRHRQLERVADGSDDPARRQRGQPGRPRGPPGHHRQPQLLDDAARPVLMALRDSVGIERVIVDTYQAVSGTGADAIAEFEGQIRAHVAGEPKQASVYPHPIAFNALPQVDVFLDNGYTKEEWKLVTESRKILHLPDLRISSTAVRVPVFVAHSEAVHVETREPLTPARAPASSSAAVPGVVVQDDPSTSTYPLATDAAGTDEIYVGRVRAGRIRSPTAAASRSGSSATTSARAPRRTRSRSPRSLVARGWVAPAPAAPRRAGRRTRSPRRPEGRRDPRRAPGGARRRRGPGPRLHPLPPPRDPHERRPRRGQPRHRGRVRRRGPGLQRGPARAGRSSVVPATS